MIPTALASSEDVKATQFQSRNRETYDSNSEATAAATQEVTRYEFQSRNRETYDSNF